jgi:hypothetical protein
MEIGMLPTNVVGIVGPHRARRHSSLEVTPVIVREV